MRAILKSLISPDIPDLKTFYPETEDDFEFLLELFVGPEHAEGDEMYSLVVCTPKRLQRITQEQGGIMMGKNYLIVTEYNYEQINNYLIRRVGRYTGDTWEEIANSLSRFAQSEFE